MKIEREITGDVAVLGLRGEFDSFVVGAFLQEIEGLVASGVRHVVLDMRLVKFIMSTAIGAIVKSRKQLKELGGDLVVSAPSPFVRDVLDSLGLTRVIRVFDENMQAVESLGEHLAGAPSGNSAVLHFVDPARQSALGKPAVGRIVELSEEGMSLQVAHAASFFPTGTDLRAKFRLPLFRKAHYFEVPAKVADAVANEQGALVKLRFAKMGDDERASIRQFVADMQFLRDEVRNAEG